MSAVLLSAYQLFCLLLTGRLLVLKMPGLPPAALTLAVFLPLVLTPPGLPTAASTLAASLPLVLTPPGLPAAASSLAASLPLVSPPPGLPPSASALAVFLPLVLIPPGLPPSASALAASLPPVSPPRGLQLPSSPLPGPLRLLSSPLSGPQRLQALLLSGPPPPALLPPASPHLLWLVSQLPGRLPVLQLPPDWRIPDWLAVQRRFHLPPPVRPHAGRYFSYLTYCLNSLSFVRSSRFTSHTILIIINCFGLSCKI